MSPLDRLAWLSVVAADADLTSGALRIAMVLPQWIGKDGDCFPSVASIGRASGMTERNARRRLRELEARGWIGTDRSAGRSSNVYHLTRTLAVLVDAAEPGPSQPGLKTSNPDTEALQPGHIDLPTRTLAVRLTREQGEQDATSVPLSAVDVVGPEFTTKAGTTWRAPRSLVEKLTAAYPSTDIPVEMAKASAWCEANPGKRKTVVGMAKYLGGWIARARPGQSANQYPTPGDTVREFTPEEAAAIMADET